MGNLKCEISQERLIVERNGRKFGTWITTVHVCRAVLMPDTLSLVWGHSVHFAKFSSNSSKLFIVYHNHTGCHFSGDRPDIAKIIVF